MKTMEEQWTHLIKKHDKSKSSFFKISKMLMTDLFKKKEKTQISRIKNGKYTWNTIRMNFFKVW